MANKLPFALFDAFSAGTYGGAKAGIVSDAGILTPEQMQAIAIEIGAPATAFLIKCTQDLIYARFFSTKTEYGMCGHGTVGLGTMLLEDGSLTLDANQQLKTNLRTGSSQAVVHFSKCNQENIVSMDITPSTFASANDINAENLLKQLGLSTQDVSQDLPIERAIGDFVHLQIPVIGLHAIAHMNPNFDELTKICNRHHIDTITAFTQEVEDPENTVHVRDFAPAVGTPESPAAGTTNAALTGYLIRHSLLTVKDNDSHVVRVEQGFECNRPSLISSEVTVKHGQVVNLRVGGTATRSITGEIFVP